MRPFQCVNHQKRIQFRRGSLQRNPAGRSPGGDEDVRFAQIMEYFGEKMKRDVQPIRNFLNRRKGPVGIMKSKIQNRPETVKTAL